MNDDNQNSKSPQDDAAADLVRQRIEALYADVEGEAEKHHSHTPLIDAFWQQHEAHPDHHLAWKDYYAGLNEDDKHRLWQQYHLSVGSNSGVPEVKENIKEAPPEPKTKVGKAVAPVKKRVEKRTEVVHSKRIHAKKKKKARKTQVEPSFFRNHLWPIISAALVIGVVWVVFNNELIVARVQQYVTPGNTQSTPVIIDPTVNVSDENKVIIPKINVDVPVVYDITTYEEAAIQAGLERGVVHYGTTALPGQVGNNVIVGHSSNNFFNGGKYKFAFVLLNRLELGDTFILHFEGVRYVYKVTVKEVVEPNDFTYVQPTAVPTTTLITCDPPGTSWRRLIIQGEQISPDPSGAEQAVDFEINEEDPPVVPGNAPSLWENVWNWLF